MSRLHQNEVEDSGKATMGIPSLTLKIGNVLIKCASIERGNCLRQGDMSSDLKFKYFLALMQIEWAEMISLIAVSTLNINKLNKVMILTLTSHIVKLNWHLDKTMKICISAPIKLGKSWKKLVQVKLTRLIMFNKKKSGKASRKTLRNNSSSPDRQSEGSQESLSSLTPLEKNFLSNMKLV